MAECPDMYMARPPPKKSKEKQEEEERKKQKQKVTKEEEQEESEEEEEEETEEPNQKGLFRTYLYDPFTDSKLNKMISEARELEKEWKGTVNADRRKFFEDEHNKKPHLLAVAFQLNINEAHKMEKRYYKKIAEIVAYIKRHYKGLQGTMMLNDLVTRFEDAFVPKTKEKNSKVLPDALL